MLVDILHKLPKQRYSDGGSVFRPSSAGPEKCIRQLVYEGMKTKPAPLPGRAHFIFDDGHWHEELTADWIRKSSFDLHSSQMHVDIPVSFEHPEIKCFCGAKRPANHISGHIDGILTDLLDRDTLWEHKAINHFTWQSFSGGELPMDYITQCCLYIKGLHDVAVEIEDCCLLIKNKNTAQYCEFVFSYDVETDICKINSISNTIDTKIIQSKNGNEIKDVYKGVDKKFCEVKEHLDAGTLPDRQYELSHWRCQYCGYFTTCYADYEKEFAQMQTEAELPGDVIDLVRYYRETGGQIKDMQKENDELKDKIKAVMRESNIREGYAGEYLCKLSYGKRKHLNRDKIPLNILDEATEIRPFETLRIGIPKKR